MSQLQVDFTPGDVIAGKFEILDRLAEDPVGVTYRVRNQKNENTLRLVLLDPRMAGSAPKQDVIDAIRFARNLNTPNTLKAGEAGQHNGVAFICFEDFDGITLRELIDASRGQQREFSLREAAQITIQALEAAQFAHDSGRFIRGIRPEHILVRMKKTGPKGSNTLIDARVTHVGLWDLVPSGTLAEHEFSKGEAQYIAPELKGVDPKVDPRADVFSAGVLFYELLTGQPPMGPTSCRASAGPSCPRTSTTSCSSPCRPPRRIATRPRPTSSPT